MHSAGADLVSSQWSEIPGGPSTESWMNSTLDQFSLVLCLLLRHGNAYADQIPVSDKKHTIIALSTASESTLCLILYRHIMQEAVPFLFLASPARKAVSIWQESALTYLGSAGTGPGRVLSRLPRWPSR